MWSRTRTTLAVVVLVAVAALARAIGLDDGLWVDEIYSLVRSFRAPASTILTEYWGDNHHPLYALLARGSLRLFGESAWAIRLPALLFGVATVPALFALGSLLVTRREAFLVALLLAVSYHHVWFSQNARGYSAIAFFTTVGLWALLRGVRSGRLEYFALYGVLAALGAYTHLTMVLVVVGHALAVAVWLLAPGAPHAAAARHTGAPDATDAAAEVPEDGAALRGALVAFGLGAAVTLVLYAPMMHDVLNYFMNRPSALRGISTPRWAMLEGLRVLALGVSGGQAVVGAAVVALGVVVGASGIVSLWRRDRLFVLALAAPVLVTIAGAAAARGTMYPRFFFFAIAPALLVVVRGGFAVAGGAAALVRRPGLAPAVGTAGTGAVIAVSALSLALNYRYPKQDFLGAMHFVLAERGAADRVVTTGLPANPYRMLYDQPWGDVKTRAELDSLRALGGQTWVVWTFPRYLASFAPEIDQVLRDECPRPRAFRGTVGGGDILVCALHPK